MGFFEGRYEAVEIEIKRAYFLAQAEKELLVSRAMLELLSFYN